jgi:hypothetical protein
MQCEGTSRSFRLSTSPVPRRFALAALGLEGAVVGRAVLEGAITL